METGRHVSLFCSTLHKPLRRLPRFVAKYKGKVVAITGYEADAVRVHPDGTEEHVPLFEQYNHHHCACESAATRGVVRGVARSALLPRHRGGRILPLAFAEPWAGWRAFFAAGCCAPRSLPLPRLQISTARRRASWT